MPISDAARPVRLTGILAAALLAAPAPIAAQPTAKPAAPPATGPVSPELTAVLRWRNLGPFRAGRVGAVSGAIGQPGTYYAGYPGGGLWKSTNAGQSWRPIFDAIRTVSSVGAVDVAPSNPDIVYVGTGDMITGGTLDQGNGVYKSTDAGATWQHLGLEGTRHIQTLLVDPRSPDVVLVGALGDHVALSDQRGVFRSTDGGKSWTRTLYIDQQIGVTKLARAFDAPDVLFATTARHYTPPGYAVGSYRSWQFSTTALPDTGPTGTAIYKSRDGGQSWTEIRGGGLPRLSGRLSIAVANGTNAQRVFVISNSALYRSDDGGTTWRQMAADDDRIRNGQGGYSAGVYVNTKNPDIVYTINTAAYKSVDGGATFTGMKGAPGGDDPQQLWLDPTNGDRLFMGLDQGATVSLDGGATWSSWYNQSTEQLYHLAVDNSVPRWIYATQQDAGAIRTRLRGNLGAITMFDWNPVNGWEWGTIVPDPRDPNTVFASGTGVVRISYPSEQWINVSPTIDPATAARTTSSAPLLFAPWNTRRLFAGFQYVASTDDRGVHWTRRSGDLGIPPGMDSTTAANTLGGRGAIESMGAAAIDPNVLWVGTNNGLIHVTRDSGTSWRNVSIAGIPSPLRANISAIEASPLVPGTAYAAVEYLRIGDHTPYLFRTRDYGRTWTKITTGLPTAEPSGSFARVIRADPVRKGLLFAGTESSIYVSFDDGDHWQSLANNLPNVPVRDLTIAGNDLIIATHGRGLWVIDDLSMLRQVTPAIAASPVHLFAPGDALRVRRNVNADTPLPPEIPHAENPLDGAIIDYWLGAGSTGRVSLEVRAANGTVVRRYTSDAIAPVAEAARPPHPNFWVATPEPLPTTPGMHRVHWDLRADAPPVFSHSFEISANPGLTPASPEGPLVAPGVYTVVLTAGGTTVTQRVTVRHDPRSPATVAEVTAQSAHMAELTALLRASMAGHEQVAAVRAALAQRASAPPSAAILPIIVAANAAIDKAVGSATPVPGRSGAAVPTFRSVNSTAAALLMAQDNGDAAPTPSMRAAFAAVCRSYQTVARAWQQVMTAELRRVNEALTAAGGAAIMSPTVSKSAALAAACQ